MDNVRYYSSGAFGSSRSGPGTRWLLQEAAAGGDFIRDDVAFLGPFTLRHIGYAVTAFFSLAIGLAIIRDPRPERLILGSPRPC